MFKLIKNAHIYGPQDLGVNDVLICGNLIVAIGKNINFNFESMNTIDAKNKIMMPGLIDQHVHVTGGGGEAGFQSRVTEIKMTDCVMAGVTTLVGLLGTDSITRSVENLVAKTKALNNEGLTAYCLTGSYEYPTKTITGSIRNDIAFINEIIGVKIALSDHRESYITIDEFARLAADARIAGLLAGKPGYIHIHMGNGKYQLDKVFELVEKYEIPISQFRPTHVGKIYDEAIKFANMGGIIDFTAGENVKEVASTVLRAINEAPIDNITLSSDSNGSMPIWNDNKELIGIGVGKISLLFDVVKSLIVELNVPISQSIQIVTQNVAKAIGVQNKRGSLAVGKCADMVLLDKDYNIDTVIANGKLMMIDKKLIVKDTFL